MIDFLSNNYTQILVAVPAIIGGASMLAAAIAGLTKNKVDDEIASWLKKAHSLFSKLALNPKK